MLTFFRRIRNGLLGAGQGHKYLLYAVGEIALVVIGILIALQINNWNEDRKANQIEAVLVESLKTELLDNKAYINDYTYNHLDRIDSIGRLLLNNFGINGNLIKGDSFDLYLENIITAIYTPRAAKFDQAINSEEINYIRNDSLRLLLADYKSRLFYVEINYRNLHENIEKIQEYLNKHYSRRNTIHKSQLQRFKKINNIGRSSFDHDHKHLFLDPYFENILAERIVLCTYLHNRMEQLLNHIEVILKYIDKTYK